MELTCKQCSAKFRAAVVLPLTQPVRVACPACRKQVVLRPAPAPVPMPVRSAATPASQRLRQAVIADEPRAFRNFLVSELGKHGFEVKVFDSGDGALDFVRESRANLVILNVYLRGKLGVEISEDIKADPALSHTKVVLIGALFRANRFRANPTNLYGADDYIEELIPAKELQQMIRKLFPAPSAVEEAAEPLEFEEARRLARLILSDIVIYNARKVDEGIRDDSFFATLETEIREGREYYESRVPYKVRQQTEFFDETLQQFVQMKREEISKNGTGVERK